MASLKLVEDYATRINQSLAKSVEAVLDVGRQLLDAKKTLPHGDFTSMFRRRLVPFSLNTAERLMVIARHPLLSNSAHAQTLPSSWMTLYELSKLPPGVLQKALNDGTIRPDITLGVVSGLRSSPASARESQSGSRPSAQPGHSASTSTKAPDSSERPSSRPDYAQQLRDAQKAQARMIQEVLRVQINREERKAQITVGLEVIDAGFRAVARRTHPDVGGTDAAMIRLTKVRDRLKDLWQSLG